MARAKKDGKRINFYMKTAISDLLDLYCDEVGQTKTEATERILKLYLERYFPIKNSGAKAKRKCINVLFFNFHLRERLYEQNFQSYLVQNKKLLRGCF